MRNWAFLIFGLVVVVLAGCSSKPQVVPTQPVEPAKPQVALERPANLYEQWTPPLRSVPAHSDLALLAPNDYPVFDDDLNYQDLDHAITQSLVYLARVPKDRVFEASGLKFTKEEIERTLWKIKDFIALNPTVGQLNNFIRANFFVFQSKGRNDRWEIMFTGYFEPIYYGSLTKTNRFRYPVYARPKDLGQLNPYHTRKEIDGAGALYGKADILAWLESPLDSYFLHIQGSGRVILPDGSNFHLNFDAKNGREYKSLGAALIDGGYMTKEEMSMQGIYDYFAQNPQLCEPILHRNDSYVFFRAENDGPFGSLAVAVTPGRTLALDKTVYPPGILMLAQVQKPVMDSVGQIQEWVPMTRFMLHQDAGGAIKGPGRADFFWGSGEYATTAAGYMKHFGKLYFILPKN